MAIVSSRQSESNEAQRPAWHRWVRRTNVYIAEYVLMLVLTGAFLGVLVSLWYSFFNLIMTDGYSGRLLAMTAAVQLGALLVVGPAAYWLYARVTGQESQQPELYGKTSRNVFLTLWLLVAVLSLVGILVSIVSALSTALFGFGGDTGKTIVTAVLPGLFAAATVAFGLFVVVKHSTWKFARLVAIVLASVAALLLIANLVMVVVRKDAGSAPSNDCTFARYMDRECTYNEYLEYQQLNRSSSNSNRSETGLEGLFNTTIR